MRFNYNKTEDNVGVLKLSGILDKTTSPNVKKIIKGHLESTEKVVLEFSSVKSVDAAGLGCLFSCADHASKRNGDVRIANPSNKSMMVFEITKAAKAFRIYKDLGTAVKSFH